MTNPLGVRSDEFSAVPCGPGSSRIAASYPHKGADRPVISLRARIEIETALAAEPNDVAGWGSGSACLHLTSQPAADPHAGLCTRYLDEASPILWTGSRSGSCGCALAGFSPDCRDAEAQAEEQ